MKKHKKKIVNLIVAVLGLYIVLTPISVGAATNSVTDEDLVEMTQIFNDNIEYDHDEKEVSFNNSNAKDEGMDEKLANDLKAYYETLAPEEKIQHYENAEDIGIGTNSIAIGSALLAALAETLALAGWGWLATLLLNMGLDAFCEGYKYYNDLTRSVCRAGGF